jgi:hypothetical protein
MAKNIASSIRVLISIVTAAVPDACCVRITRMYVFSPVRTTLSVTLRSIGGRRAEGFQNDQVVILVVRNTRPASVVTETMAGHRPTGSPTSTARSRGMPTLGSSPWACLWQVCLAHQPRDCKYAIEAGDTIFAPRMKALLLRAVVLDSVSLSVWLDSVWARWRAPTKR